MACGTRDTVIIDWLFIYCVNTTFKHLKPVQYNIINSFGIQSEKKPPTETMHNYVPFIYLQYT